MVIDWCEYVDWVGINAKYPTYIQGHLVSSDRSQKIREVKRKWRIGSELLAELHRWVTPVVSHAGANKNLVQY